VGGVFEIAAVVVNSSMMDRRFFAGASGLCFVEAFLRWRFGLVFCGGVPSLALRVGVFYGIAPSVALRVGVVNGVFLNEL
jgi:hypothetical protein